MTNKVLKVDYDLVDGEFTLPNERIPTMAGWQVCVQPDTSLDRDEEGDVKSAGGIIIPEIAMYKEEYMNTHGTVVAIGEGAFCDRDDGAPWVGIWPEVGDKVLYRSTSTAGSNFEVEGVRLNIMKDEDIKAVLHPDSFVANHFKMSQMKSKEKKSLASKVFQQ